MAALHVVNDKRLRGSDNYAETGFYSLPILLGVTLSLLGINFWISSLEEERVSGWKLVAGCLCMALVAGCKPQLVLGSLLIIPIYWDAVFIKRQLFSAVSKGKTTLAVLSYVFVAIGLMLYNWKRFDSPFDFGANYNLTTNDMTKRGFELGRIPAALFRYYGDFGWLFYLSALFAWFTKWISKRESEEGTLMLRKAQNIMFAIGMAFAFLLLFTDSSNTLREANPELFYYFYYKLAFWA